MKKKFINNDFLLSDIEIYNIISYNSLALKANRIFS